MCPLNSLSVPRRPSPGRSSVTCPGMRRHRTACTAPGSPERDTGRHPAAHVQMQGARLSPPGAAVRIHTTLSHAPFLKHPQLSPAQRRYLDSVAGSQSAERVYGLLNQHYLNVLRRRIRPGNQEDFLLQAAAEGEAAQETGEIQSEATQPIQTAAAKHSGKPSLTKPPVKKLRRAVKAKSRSADETKTGSCSELLGQGDELLASPRDSWSSLSTGGDEDRGVQQEV